MNLRVGRAAVRLALFCFSAGLWGQTEEQAKAAQHAKELMASGKYEEAIPIYRSLVAALPGNTGLVQNLAIAEHMAGHELEAIPHLETVLKTQPGNIPVRNMLAGALLDVGRFEQAAAQLRELTALSPNDPHSWYGLGMSYQGLAEAAFDRLQKANPTSPYVTALVADTRVKRRQYRSAFFFYQETLKQLPALHGIHAALAEVYRKTGHPDWAAEEDSSEAALATPDCKAHAAECEFLAGHDAPLTKVPVGAASAETLYWQAKAANELALQSFFRLGQLPESVELHQLRADIARAQGQHQESVREWRAALALKPGNPALERELAVSLFLAADFHPALELIKELLKAAAAVSGIQLHGRRQPGAPRGTGGGRALPAGGSGKRSQTGGSGRIAGAGSGAARKACRGDSPPAESTATGRRRESAFPVGRRVPGGWRSGQSKAMMEKYQQIVKREQETKEEVAREAQIGPPK